MRISVVLGLFFLSACAHPPARNVAGDAIPVARRIIDDSFIPADPRKIKVAFFDADSTLRVSRSGNVSANGPRDVYLLPYMSSKLRRLAEEGYLIYIVSNQGGIKAGLVKEDVASEALRYTIRLIREDGGVMHGYDYAEDEVNRKPGPGMKDRLEEALKAKFGPAAKIDTDRSLMVGDSAYLKDIDRRPDGKIGTHFSNADRRFAEGLGIPFYEASVYFGWRDYGVDVFGTVSEVDAFLERCAALPDCVERFRRVDCPRILGAP